VPGLRKISECRVVFGPYSGWPLFLLGCRCKLFTGGCRPLASTAGYHLRPLSWSTLGPPALQATGTKSGSAGSERYGTFCAAHPVPADETGCSRTAGALSELAQKARYALVSRMVS